MTIETPTFEEIIELVETCTDGQELAEKMIAYAKGEQSVETLGDAYPYAFGALCAHVAGNNKRRSAS